VHDLVLLAVLFGLTLDGTGAMTAAHLDPSSNRSFFRSCQSFRSTHHKQHNQFIEVLTPKSQCAWHPTDLDEADTLIKVHRGFIASGHGKLDLLDAMPRRGMLQGSIQ
jgi:hypothetical protein